MSKNKPGGPEQVHYLTGYRGIIELVVFVGAGIASLLILTTLVVYTIIRYAAFCRPSYWDEVNS